MNNITSANKLEITVRLRAGDVILDGDLSFADQSRGMVLFAHGSGSSRHSVRNQFVAEYLRRGGLATLLIDLLTEREEIEERYSGHLRFDIGLLAGRLVEVTDWLGAYDRTASLPIGYFGASTGAGAALVAASRRRDRVAAVVSRGGRPDLARDALPLVQSPTLLIVGGDDVTVVGLNRQAFVKLGAKEKNLAIVPGATHLFEETGKLQEVAKLASAWFNRYLALTIVENPRGRVPSWSASSFDRDTIVPSQ